MERRGFKAGGWRGLAQESPRNAMLILRRRKRAEEMMKRRTSGIPLTVVARPSADMMGRTGGWRDPSRGTELKYWDTDITELFESNNSDFNTANVLNAVTPGTGANNRIGKKLRMKSFMLRYTLSTTVNGVGITGSCSVRILIVYDRQANAILATPPVVLQTVAGNAQFHSMQNLDNRDRFAIIADEIVGPIGVEAFTSYSGKIWRRLNHDVTFNQGTSDIGSITTGALLIFMAQSGDMAATANNPCDVTWSGRLRFTDN